MEIKTSLIYNGDGSLTIPEKATLSDIIRHLVFEEKHSIEEICFVANLIGREDVKNQIEKLKKELFRLESMNNE